MKLNLEEINYMIKGQLRILESRINTINVYSEIDINDFCFQNINHQIEIGEMALLRLKKYKQKLLAMEFMEVTREIKVMTEIMKSY